MLHIVSGGMPVTEHAVLRAMFAARKSVFVDLLKWDVPVLDGRFEIDQFDDQHATYLILLDDQGRHLASARLLPTTGPHLLADLFSHLCEAEPPREPGVHEITRFCLDRGLDASGRRVVRNRLVKALVDHALAQGIIAYTAIAEMGWFQQILALGWRCRPLGLPQPSCKTLIAALRIEVGADTPNLLAEAGIISDPIARIACKAA